MDGNSDQVGGIIERGRVVAILGPTNTGKTYLAMERMLGHRSGMIGFPLRLLARENYERAVAVKGAGAVALITGEEMIVPSAPQYFVCTVEAMPVDRPVAFLAVDEIQLCADPERGHIFTDRLLRARGLEETMFLGADTIRPLLQKLLRRVEFISRPRFSALTYAGARKLTRLPPRSAVVAFSASEVYSLAEMLRRQRGGTAVVLGALSPRTRNAQVALYQSGDVDYLVATDAIGMGLNMDVDHVAFAGLSKFDGESPRRLMPSELAQIAGRAGRHARDGTFGTTADVPGIEETLVAAVEGHTFPALQVLRWRNPDLDLRSPALLLRSLERRPPRPELRRAREGDDHQALAALARDAEIVRLADGHGAVELLWDVCRIPDFRKILSDAHTRLLGQIYRHLRAPARRLPTDWVAQQVSRLDRVDGDIDALVARLAHIRTWTYVSNRGGWLQDARHWQDQTRALEDRVSDTLHERLTQRFVDRRAAVLVRSLAGGGELLSSVTAEGAVQVEGEEVGRIEGFRFIPDFTAHAEDSRALMAAARRALRGEVASRLRQLEEAPDDALSVEPDGIVHWRGAPLACLVAGPSPLVPGVQPLHDDLMDSAQRERVRMRVVQRVEKLIGDVLAPLLRLEQADLGASSRGIAFQLREALGGLNRVAVAPLLATLDKEERRRLHGLGVHLGLSRLYMPALLKPRAVALRGLLWAVRHGLPLPPPLPFPGRPSVPVPQPAPESQGNWPAYWEAIGYPQVGPRVVRADLLDRFESAARAAVTAGTAPDGRPIGCPEGEMSAVLQALGFRFRTTPEGGIGWQLPVPPRPRRANRPARPKGTGTAGAISPPADDFHPFAALRQLGGQ